MATQIICVSEATKEDVVQHFRVSEERISVAHHGVRQCFIHRNGKAGAVLKVREKYKIPKDYFLFVGTLEPRKNLKIIIKAFETLGENRKRFCLVIVGKRGWYYSEIFELVKEHRLQDEVIFLGYVPDADLVGLYKNAKLFLYPSQYEGFGFPPLEAMACGLPAIISDTAALREVAGGAALTVNATNIAELKRAMHTICSKPDVERELISKGYEQAQKFSWESSSRKILAIYERILSQKSGSPVYAGSNENCN